MRRKIKSSLWLLWTVIVLVVLFAAIFSIRYIVKQKDTSIAYTYNGFTFTQIEGLWYTQVQLRDTELYTVPLHFSPRDVQNITVSGSVTESFYAGDVYITFDPDEKNFDHVQLAAGELTLNLVKAIGLNPVAACTKNLSGCSDRPIVSCGTDPVIYLKQSDTPAVTLQGNCVIIEGRYWDIVRATDRLILEWYGIMQ